MQRRALPPADQDNDIRKIKRALDTDIKAVEHEVRSLDEAIQKVEAQLARRMYVRNLDTKSTHRLLTSISDVGMRASTFCGCKYALKDFEVTAAAPTARKETCGACLSELRASN